MREFGYRDATLDEGRQLMTKPHGRHPDKRLTAVRARNAKEPGRHADGNGLYLFVDDSGANACLFSDRPDTTVSIAS